MTHDVTMVVTSCGRLDLLERTIGSFDRFSDVKGLPRIIIDDSGDEDIYHQLEIRFGGSATLLFNRPKLGQLASIDAAYAFVQTPYIFHCEDDWEFHRGGFIAESKEVLEAEPRCLMVHLRDLWDNNAYVPERQIKRTAGATQYRLLEKVCVGGNGQKWYGFSFNPGLRRMRDYKLLAPFAKWGNEHRVNEVYGDLGLRAAILEESAVEHIGDDRHVHDPIALIGTSGTAVGRIAKEVLPPIVTRMVRRAWCASRSCSLRRA